MKTSKIRPKAEYRCLYCGGVIEHRYDVKHGHYAPMHEKKDGTWTTQPCKKYKSIMSNPITAYYLHSV